MGIYQTTIVPDHSLSNGVSFQRVSEESGISVREIDDDDRSIFSLFLHLFIIIAYFDRHFYNLDYVEAITRDYHHPQ